MRPFILYSQGSYFGDSDILPKLSNVSKKSEDLGRDSTAFCDSQCKIFSMRMNEIIKIKDNFQDVYNEMLKLSI